MENTKKSKNFYWIQFSLFITFFLICFSVLYWFYYIFPYVTASNAYIEGRQVMICPENDGKIISSNVIEGDLVKKGQVLFQLDDSLTQSERNHVVATLSGLKEKGAFCKKLLDDSMQDYLDKRRQKDQGIIEQDELIASLQLLEKRKDSFEEVKNGLFIQEMKLEHMNQKLSQKSVQAPFDGIITKCHYSKGSYVEKKDPVFCLFDAQKIWAYALISENEIHKVKLGSSAEIFLKAYPNLFLTGNVEFIAPTTQLLNEKKLIPVKISINLQNLSEETFICNGMSANIKILIK